MATKLNEDAAAVAVYLAKLEGHHIPGIREAKSLEDLRELVSFFVIEHHQHELDMAAIRLAGPAATKTSGKRLLRRSKPGSQRYETCEQAAGA